MISSVILLGFCSVTCMVNKSYNINGSRLYVYFVISTILNISCPKISRY
jgi:hypothetical protein